MVVNAGPAASSDDVFSDFTVAPDGSTTFVATGTHRASGSTQTFTHQTLGTIDPAGTVTRVVFDDYRRENGTGLGAFNASGNSINRLGDGKFLVTGAGEDPVLARYDADLKPNTEFSAESIDGEQYFTAIPGSSTVLTDTSFDARTGRVLVTASGDAERFGGAVGSGVVLAFKSNAMQPQIDLNDQVTEAIPLYVPWVYEGRVENAYDVAMFKVRIVAGQTMTIDVDRTRDSGLDSYLRLFDANGKQLAVSDNAPGPGEGAGTKDSFITYRFSKGGNYYIGVSGKSNRYYSAVTGKGDVSSSWGRFNLFTTLTDTNDTLATATPLRAGGQYRGPIMESETDVDLYRITVSAGQRVGFDVDVDPSNWFPGNDVFADTYMRLFDAGGNELAANGSGLGFGGERRQSDSEPRSPYLAYTFTAGGTYYLGISGESNRSYNPVTGPGDTPAGSPGGCLLDVRVHA